MKLPVFTPILLLTTIAPSFAADRHLAEELVEVTRYADVVDASVETCVDTVRDTNVEADIQRMPELFGGITPASPLWPEARQAYLVYMESSCYTFDKDKAIEAVVREYAAGLSNSEIQSVLAFYETDAGRRFRDAGKVANSAANREAIDKSSMHSAYNDYIREIDRLVGEHLKYVSVLHDSN
ncbi:DUF2059 domain-containing protein [Lysobacter maris]|uniref:DUF2059 domain-containing protein n=1 Tax=Marilutibacter maris TaxID=1605891 RepID=A0A508B8Q6_9GAMM|nr:DUF2059 domain-containing protein [Lysobacter maris]KAB8196214.1 DUF2059 domain-containing protein [Lysobacter maris]